MNALAGLGAKTEGQKYLLHTHPNNIYSKQGKTDEQDYFSGTPNDLFNTGDASIPTLLGIKSIFDKAKFLGQPLGGYNGIYLASPAGKLYYYAGYGLGKYYGNTYDEVRDRSKMLVANTSDFPQSKVQWSYDTNTYTLGYWDANGKFIKTP